MTLELTHFATAMADADREMREALRDKVRYGNLLMALLNQHLDGKATVPMIECEPACLAGKVLTITPNIEDYTYTLTVESETDNEQRDTGSEA